MARRPALHHPDVLLATWLGSGYLPKAPGTWGSLAALPVAALLLAAGGPVVLAVAAVLVTLAGLWAATGYMRRSRTHDPGPVVVDEVAGQWLALMPAAALEPLHYVAGFLFFRLFDILKPWPANRVDRDMPGAWGVMLDDLVAGLYAALALLLLRHLTEGGL